MLAAGVHLQAILDASLDEYRTLIPEQGLACEFKKDGLLYVFQTEHAMEEFAENDRFLTKHIGVAARRIEGKELPSFDPGAPIRFVGSIPLSWRCIGTSRFAESIMQII